MPEVALPWVAVLGPDGAGKTSVIVALKRMAGARGIQVEVFHWRPGVLKGRTEHSGGPVTDPHGMQASVPLVSVAKLAFLLLDWWLGYFLYVRPMRAAGKLVVFDRSFLDLLVDPVRYRYGGPPGLAEVFSRALPTPSLVVLLDAPVEMLRARKQEVTHAETVRQRAAYVARVEALPNGHVLDASRPVENVARDMFHLIMGMAEPPGESPAPKSVGDGAP